MQQHEAVENDQGKTTGAKDPLIKYYRIPKKNLSKPNILQKSEQKAADPRFKETDPRMQKSEPNAISEFMHFPKQQPPYNIPHPKSAGLAFWKMASASVAAANVAPIQPSSSKNAAIISGSGPSNSGAGPKESGSFESDDGYSVGSCSSIRLSDSSSKNALNGKTVSEIFHTAAAAFHQLGDLVLTLQEPEQKVGSSAEPNEAKWTETKANQLKSSLGRLTKDISDISGLVLQGTKKTINMGKKRPHPTSTVMKRQAYFAGINNNNCPRFEPYPKGQRPPRASDSHLIVNRPTTIATTADDHQCQVDKEDGLKVKLRVRSESDPSTSAALPLKSILKKPGGNLK